MANFDLSIVMDRIATALQRIGGGSEPGLIPVVTATVAALIGLTATVGLNRLLNNRALGNRLLGGADTDAWGNWAKEIVVVTGGSSGMGRLMVEEFAQRRTTVVVLDVQAPPEAGYKFPDRVVFYQVDLTDDVAVHAVAERVRAEVGDPTVLINNAGTGHARPLLDATPAEIRSVFNVNAIAPMVVTCEFLPAMVRRNHGHVVNMASMASFVVIAANVDYSCTKAALLAFHEGLTQELKHFYHAPAVRTTIVHPSWVRTPMLGPLANHPNFRKLVIEPQVVSHAVVEQVLSGRSGSLILPWRLEFASLVRAFPSWVQEAVRDSQAHMLAGLPKRE